MDRTKVSSPGSGLVLALVFFVLYLTSLALNEYAFPDWEWFLAADNSRRILEAPLTSLAAQRHPLYPAITLPLYNVAHWAFSRLPAPLAENFAIAFPTALYGAAGVYCVYWFFRRRSDSASTLLFAALYGVSASAWVYSSFPDTYALTALLTILFFWCWVADPQRSALLAAAVAVTSFASPQQVFLALIPAQSYFSPAARKESLRRLMTFAGLLLALFVVPYQLYLSLSRSGTVTSLFAVKYLQAYGYWKHLLDPYKYINVYLNLFVFSVIGPDTENFLYQEKFPQLVDGLSWLTLLALLVYVVFLAGCLWGYRRLDGGERRTANYIVLYLCFLVVFYTWFNPRETFLYSLPVLFPWLFVLHLGISKLSGRSKKLLLIALLLVTAGNSLQLISRCHSLARPSADKIKHISAPRR